MIKLIFLLLFNYKSDTVFHHYERTMHPYNKTDTSIVEDNDNPYYKKGDTIMRHHWNAGYYYKKDTLFMMKDVFTRYNMTKDKAVKIGEDTLQDRVIVVTCDSQVVKAIETYTYNEGRVWPIKYVTSDNKPIHNICQVVDWNLNWVEEKDQRKLNPVFRKK